MSKRPPFEAFAGPIDWGYAIAMARKGRPELLNFMLVALAPSQHREAIRELLESPRARPLVPSTYLSRELDLLRAVYDTRVAALPKGSRGRKAVQLTLADEWGLRWETLREIVYRKGTYASSGGATEKPHPKKRVLKGT